MDELISPFGQTLNQSSSSIASASTLTLKNAYIVFAFMSFLGYFVIQFLTYMMWLEFIPTTSFAFLYVLLLLVLLTARVVLLMKGWAGTGEFILGCLLLAWITAVQFLSFPAIADAGGKDDFLATAAQTIVVSILMWLVGEAVGVALLDEAYRRKLRVVTACALSLLLVTVVVGVYEAHSRSGMFFFYYQKYDEVGNRVFYNYQVIADGLAIVGLMLIGLQRNFRIAAILYVCVTGLLILSNGRTALYLFLPISGLRVWTLISQRSKLLLAFSLLLVIFFAVYLGSVVSQYSDDVVVRRMSGLLTAPTEDESLVARIESISGAFDDIQEHWLLGDFMNEWWRDGERGRYVHNWLSFWICYGILPFGAFLILSFVSMKRAIYYWRRAAPVPLLLVCYGTFAIIGAKAYVWFLIWLCLGTAAGLGSLRNISTNEATT